MEDWVCDASHMDEARKLYSDWNEAIDKGQAPTNASFPSYAQVIAVVNKHAKPTDTMVTAAGGLPGETIKNWRVKASNTCLLYTSPSPRDLSTSRMPSSA